MGGGAKRGQGRPRKAAAPARLNGLAGIVDILRNGERERAQLRAAVERIRAVVADALG